MSSADIALINKAIATFEAIEPRRGASLKSALATLRSLASSADSWVSIFLQQHFALFLDLPPEGRDVIADDKEIDEIVKQFEGNLPALAMEQPDIDLDDLANLSEEQLAGLKRFGLFLLYCLKLSVKIAITGGAWANTRQAIGGSIDTGRGQAAALASGSVAAASLALAGEFEGWLKASPDFVGEDVPALVEMVKIFLTNLLGATTWFGLLQIMERDPNLPTYALFGLFGLAFFFIGGINGAGEAAVGRKFAIVRIPEEERRQAQPVLQKLFQRLSEKKAGAQMLLDFLAWYSYWDYAEGFGLLAQNRGHEQAILWGSLVIFFQFAGFGAYGIMKAFSSQQVGGHGDA